MSWLRVDDSYDSHPKLLELTEQQRWRWTRVLLHACRHHTGGRISSAALSDLGLALTIDKLVALELLHVNGDGFVIHDFDQYNRPDLTATERQRRKRSRDSERDSHALVTRDVTVSTRDENVTPRACPPSPTPTPSPNGVGSSSESSQTKGAYFISKSPQNFEITEEER